MSRTVTAPVSRSISTTHPYAPDGYEKLGDSWNSRSSSEPACSSGGIASGWNEAQATSDQPTFLPGEPRTLKASSLTSMSCSLASNRWAAILTARDSTRCEATFTAEPLVGTPRDPIVPMPCSTVAVSPVRTAIRSNEIPSSSEAIWANTVSWPCPCGDDPAKMIAEPSGWIRTWADSHEARWPKPSSDPLGPNPAISSHADRPIPSSGLVRSSRRAACSARTAS